MKKTKKILVIALGALIIGVGINITDLTGRGGEPPRPQGSIQTIHLG